MLRAAALQMNSGDDLSLNLEQAHELLLQAVDRKADLVAFPENFAIMTEDSKKWLAAAETPTRGLVVETLSEWAIEYGIWILGGTHPLKVPGGKKATNSTLVFSPEGELAARYDKIHLFDAEVPGDRTYRESDHVKPGRKPTSFETPWGDLALAVCYDLRFPELFRKLSREKDPLAFFLPSAFTEKTGKAHWDALTRARAIENQAFLVAPAQTGTHPGGRKTHGHSRIVDPWGRTLAERPAGSGVVWADLDPRRIDDCRGKLPVLDHRVFF
jgi:predicted amidohydrolase